MLVAYNDNKGITYLYSFKVKKLYGSCDNKRQIIYLSYTYRNIAFSRAN